MFEYIRRFMFLSAIVGAVCLVSGPAAGGYPGQLYHQGVIAVHGERFTGEGDFRFALVDRDTDAYLWVNDGSGVATAERPMNPVTLTVVNGIYNVRLGDTDLANMTAIPRAVFNEDNVVLRIWFDDGINGVYQLSPDQVLTSVPYAQRLPNVFVDENTGNVGIGTTTPDNALSVDGDADVSGSLGIGTATPANELSVAGNADFSGNVGLGTDSPQNKLDVGGGAVVGCAYAGTTSGPPNGLLVEGNVGIGTKTPQNELDVEGSAVVGSSYSGLTTAPADSLLVEGSIGIGTSSPQNKLDVEGGAVVGYAYSGTETAPSNGLLVEGNVGIGTDEPANALSVAGNADFSGNVGIGTTAPTAKLHVSGAPGVDGIKFPNDTLQTTAAKAHALDADGGDFEDVVFVDRFGSVSLGVEAEYGDAVDDQFNEIALPKTSLASPRSQSFIAGQTGKLVSVELKVSNTDLWYAHVMTVNIYEGPDYSGRLIGTGRADIPRYHDDEKTCYINNAWIVAGRTYTWVAGGTDQLSLYYGEGNPYPDGQADIGPDADYWFRTYVAEALSATGEVMRSTADGNVGIGTTAPQRKLHLKGNAWLLGLEGETHAFIEWHPYGWEQGRAWVGFGEAGEKNFAITNEIPDGDIVLSAVGGDIRLHPAGSGKVDIAGGNLRIRSVYKNWILPGDFWLTVDTFPSWEEPPCSESPSVYVYYITALYNTNAFVQYQVMVSVGETASAVQWWQWTRPSSDIHLAFRFDNPAAFPRNLQVALGGAAMAHVYVSKIQTFP